MWKPKYRKSIQIRHVNLKKFVFLFTLFCSRYTDAQVNRIDHFFVSSPRAEQLFKIFRDQFGLPVSWDYKSWGSFSSGAVTLGNTSFEFVLDSIATTKFDAIALEPAQAAEQFIALIDAIPIAHDTIENNTYKKKDGSLGGWSTINLQNLLPSAAGLFVCDYKERKRITDAAKNDATELQRRNGGPLGVLSLKEIVVSTNNPELYTNQLTKLPGISIGKNNICSFYEGAYIRLSRSKTTGIEKIVIRVRSLDKAKSYLKSLNFLGNSSGKSIFIDKKAVDGLTIELVEG